MISFHFVLEMNDLQPGHILIYDPHHCHHLTEIEKEIKILKPADLWDVALN